MQVWLALTDASPKTSCMYALPAAADLGYSTRGATATAAALFGPSPPDDEDIQARGSRPNLSPDFPSSPSLSPLLLILP